MPLTPLVASTGLDVPGGSVTVDTTSGSAGSFVYASLAAPVRLLASHNYYVMSLESSVQDADEWYDQSPLASTADFAVNSSEYHLSDGYHAATTGSYGFMAPNFLHEIAPAELRTNQFFGGDGVYDPQSGWTYHLARWREDFRFTSFDSFEADPSTPANLHKYLYANGNLN